MLRAGALFVAVALSFVIAVLVSLLITLSFHYKIQNRENLLQKKLERNCMSAFALLLSDNETGEGISVVDLYGEESDSVQLKKTIWGVFEVAAAKAFSGRYAVSKTMQYGYQPDVENATAIYLADLSRELSLCGKTKITGNCYLPERGVKGGYIEGRNFEGSTLINGIIRTSKNSLPVLNEKITKRLSESFAKNYYDNGIYKERLISDVDTLVQSYNDTTLLVLVSETLSGKYLSGNIILFSEGIITIDQSTHLEDVLVFASAIVFKETFTGSVQAFAKDSIVVEKDCKLSYPTVLGLFKKDHKTNQPFIQVMKGAEVKGLLFTTQSELVTDLAKTRISIDKEAFVHGELYVDGFAGIQGVLYGTVWCKMFIYNLANENYLLDAEIDRTKLSEHYVGSGLITSGKKKKVAKWLE